MAIRETVNWAGSMYTSRDIGTAVRPCLFRVKLNDDNINVILTSIRTSLETHVNQWIKNSPTCHNLGHTGIPSKLVKERC